MARYVIVKKLVDNTFYVASNTWKLHPGDTPASVAADLDTARVAEYPDSLPDNPSARSAVLSNGWLLNYNWEISANLTISSTKISLRTQSGVARPPSIVGWKMATGSIIHVGGETITTTADKSAIYTAGRLVILSAPIAEKPTKRIAKFADVEVFPNDLLMASVGNLSPEPNEDYFRKREINKIVHDLMVQVQHALMQSYIDSIDSDTAKKDFFQHAGINRIGQMAAWVASIWDDMDDDVKIATETWLDNFDNGQHLYDSAPVTHYNYVCAWIHENTGDIADFKTMISANQLAIFDIGYRFKLAANSKPITMTDQLISGTTYKVVSATAKATLPFYP